MAEPSRIESSLSVRNIVPILIEKKKLIAYITAGITVLSLVISLLLPNYYRSTTTLLPETEKGKMMSLGGLSDLASLAGVNLGEGTFVKLYPTIIRSSSVLKNVIYARYWSTRLKDSANLIQIWEIEEKTPELVFETALKSLREQLEISMDQKTSVVTISFETKEPQLSADVINRVTQELDRFMRTKRNTNASEQRKWIEARLSEVKNDLQRSENGLKEFREKNRRTTDSPQLLLEQERLLREMQINSTLYVELKKQYEIIKIEEIKNIPIINIIDAGSAAARKERPKRIVIVVTCFILSLIGSIGFVFVRQLHGTQIKEYFVFLRGSSRR